MLVTATRASDVNNKMSYTRFFSHLTLFVMFLGLEYLVKAI